MPPKRQKKDGTSSDSTSSTTVLTSSSLIVRDVLGMSEAEQHAALDNTNAQHKRLQLTQKVSR